jgi:glycosyltransferase involved in cell wall biosynthesis
MIPNLELRVFGLDGGDPKEPWVSWEGRRPRETVLHAVALADAYLATSRYEACSMAIIEALSVGTTVVGSPAVAWMLDGAGIAVLDYQPGSFAREIERLSASPALRRELAAAAPAAAARFSWDEAAASYGEIISSMLPRSELNA